MAKVIMIEELHVSLYVPAGTSERDIDAARQTVDERSFQAALRRAIKTLFGRYPSLSQVRIKLSR